MAQKLAYLVLETYENENKTPAKHRDIFRNTLIAKKYGEAEDRTHDLVAGKYEKIQAPARVRTHDLMAGKAISEAHFNPWSGDKVEFWQNL